MDRKNINKGLDFYSKFGYPLVYNEKVEQKIRFKKHRIEVCVQTIFFQPKMNKGCEKCL